MYAEEAHFVVTLAEWGHIFMCRLKEASLSGGALGFVSSF